MLEEEKRMIRGGMALALLVSLVGTPAMAREAAADAALEVLAEQVTISLAQAAKVAKQQVKGRVKEISLKAYQGRPVYEVEFEGDQEVAVDAKTGQIVARPRK